MKKIIFRILALSSVAAAIAACSGKGSKTDTTAVPEAEEQAIRISTVTAQRQTVPQTEV